MRTDFPNLNHHPDETFRTLSWTELIRLDNKLEANGKSSKKLTEKLAKNLEKIKSNPQKIEAGEDNRSDILHKARFLGGHTCRNTEIWLQARKTIGLTGLDPISRYDTESVGMSSNINSHIWASLHNPGSKEISIKMLSPNGLKETRGSGDKNATAIKKDFENSNEIRLALTTLKTACHFIHPWNFSFAALEFFLSSVQFGEKELQNKNNKLSFLCDFIDDVISFNAEAWDDAKPFMQANEISNKWVSEMLLKFPRTGQKQDNFDKGKKSPSSSKNPSNNKPFPKTDRSFLTVCAGGSTSTFAQSKLTIPIPPLGILPKSSNTNAPTRTPPTKSTAWQITPCLTTSDLDANLGLVFLPTFCEFL